MTPLYTVGLDKKPARPRELPGAKFHASLSFAALAGVMTVAIVLAEVCAGEYRYCGQFVNVAPPAPVAPSSAAASTPAIPADAKRRHWRICCPPTPLCSRCPELSQRKTGAKSRCAARQVRLAGQLGRQPAWMTDRTLPAGSLNQAISGPPRRLIPLESTKS